MVGDLAYSKSRGSPDFSFILALFFLLAVTFFGASRLETFSGASRLETFSGASRLETFGSFRVTGASFALGMVWLGIGFSSIESSKPSREESVSIESLSSTSLSSSSIVHCR